MKNKTNLRRGISLLLFLVFTTLFCFSQNSLTVNGQITDENGKGLEGVTVAVKGTKNQTASTADGFYKLSGLSGKETLLFTYVAYLDQEVPIGNRTTVNLS